MKKSIIAIFIVIIVLVAYFFLTKLAVAPEPESTPSAVPEPAAEVGGGVADQPTRETAGTESITISTDSLGDGQQKMLKTFGVEGDIEITPEMIACAEEKIEKERLDEIIVGATPSFMEGVALASCY